MSGGKKTNASLVFPWLLPGMLLGVIVGAFITPEEPGFHFLPFAFAVIPTVGLNFLIMWIYDRHKGHRGEAE